MNFRALLHHTESVLADNTFNAILSFKLHINEALFKEELYKYMLTNMVDLTRSKKKYKLILAGYPLTITFRTGPQLKGNIASLYCSNRDFAIFIL